MRFGKEGQTDDQHETVEAKLDKEKGVYYIEKNFNELGSYYIIAHVTARGMHNMPKVEIEVVE